MKNRIISLLFAAALLLTHISAGAQEYADTYVNNDIKYQCYKYGKEYHISPQLLMALIETESSGRQSAVNDTCYGICQINSSVWGDNYNTYEKQVEQSCKILTEHLEQEEDISYALMAYNGDKRAKKLFNSYKMSDYADKVLSRTFEIEEAQGLHDYGR